MLRSIRFPIIQKYSNGLICSYRKWHYSTDSSNAQKLSYYHHIGKDPLVYRTFSEHFEISAEKYGNREAIVSCHEGKRYTYTEVLEIVNQLASGLINIGFNKGDRIGIWSPNTTQWYLTMLALSKAGLVSVALNPAYQGPEIAQCIKKVNMRAIVAPETFKTQNYYELICKNMPEVKGSSDGIIRSKEFDSFTTLILDSPNRLKGTRTFDDVLQLGTEPTRPVEIQPDEPCNIQFTSGTTGTPKAAVLSHFNLVNSGIHLGNRSQYNEKPHRLCVPVPFFHAGGIVASMATAISYGATIVLPAPSFNAEKSLRAVGDEKCTAIIGVPTMYVDLIAKQKELNLPISSIEIAMTGGSPCPPQLLRDIKSTFNLNSVKSLYGMTELTASAFFSLINDSEKQMIETVGYLQDHLEAKVVDEMGNVVPFEQPGELCIRGYSTMLGYFNDEAKTKETISNDKWLKTGDQFILQEDGYGRIVGRFKDMIIRGGENIFPKEIEDFLSTHPDIIDVQVIGVPDDRMGEEICAFIRTTAKGRMLEHKDIKEFCTGSLAHFKIPRYVKVVDEFPLTLSGKVQKFKLKEQYDAGNSKEL